MKGILSVAPGLPGRNGTEVPGVESIAKASKGTSSLSRLRDHERLP